MFSSGGISGEQSALLPAPPNDARQWQLPRHPDVVSAPTAAAPATAVTPIAAHTACVPRRAERERAVPLVASTTPPASRTAVCGWRGGTRESGVTTAEGIR